MLRRLMLQLSPNSGGRRRGLVHRRHAISRRAMRHGLHSAFLHQNGKAEQQTGHKIRHHREFLALCLRFRGRLRGRLRRDIFLRRHSRSDGRPSHGCSHSLPMGPCPRKSRCRNSPTHNTPWVRNYTAHNRSSRTNRRVERRC
jgi:hypothetical protein